MRDKVRGIRGGQREKGEGVEVVGKRKPQLKAEMQ